MKRVEAFLFFFTKISRDEVYVLNLTNVMTIIFQKLYLSLYNCISHSPNTNKREIMRILEFISILSDLLQEKKQGFCCPDLKNVHFSGGLTCNRYRSKNFCLKMQIFIIIIL